MLSPWHAEVRSLFRTFPRAWWLVSGISVMFIYRVCSSSQIRMMRTAGNDNDA